MFPEDVFEADGDAEEDDAFVFEASFVVFVVVVDVVFFTTAPFFVSVTVLVSTVVSSFTSVVVIVSIVVSPFCSTIVSVVILPFFVLEIVFFGFGSL